MQCDPDGDWLRVPDMDESLRRLKEHGREPVYVRSPTYGPVLERFESFRSALLGDVGGVRLVLGEYRPEGFEVGLDRYRSTGV